MWFLNSTKKNNNNNILPKSERGQNSHKLIMTVFMTFPKGEMISKSHDMTNKYISISKVLNPQPVE